MTEEHFTQKDIDLADLHARILSDLNFLKESSTEIKTEVKKTNGRVTKLEKEMIGAKGDIAKYLKVLSTVSGDVVVLQKEVFKEKELHIQKYIESLEAQISDDKQQKKSAVMYIIKVGSVILLAVASATGIINIDLPLP